MTGPPSLFTHGGCTDEIAAQRSPNVKAIYYANVTICSSLIFFQYGFSSRTRKISYAIQGKTTLELCVT